MQNICVVLLNFTPREYRLNQWLSNPLGTPFVICDGECVTLSCSELKPGTHSCKATTSYSYESVLFTMTHYYKYGNKQLYMSFPNIDVHLYQDFLHTFDDTNVTTKLDILSPDGGHFIKQTSFLQCESLFVSKPLLNWVLNNTLNLVHIRKKFADSNGILYNKSLDA